MALQTYGTLTEAAEEGRLRKSLKQYLKSCLPPEGAAQNPLGRARQPSGRFPNLAGFCCWMNCGMSAFEALKHSYPEEADYIETAMEDAALNAVSVSPLLILLYLKKRLGYADLDPKPCSERSERREHRGGRSVRKQELAICYTVPSGRTAIPAENGRFLSLKHAPKPPIKRTFSVKSKQHTRRLPPTRLRQSEAPGASFPDLPTMAHRCRSSPHEESTARGNFSPFAAFHIEPPHAYRPATGQSCHSPPSRPPPQGNMLIENRISDTQGKLT